MVTDRMLEMFKAKPGERGHGQGAKAQTAKAEDAAPARRTGGTV